MIDEQAPQSRLSGQADRRRERRVAPFAYGVVLLAVFGGTWLAVLAADPARGGRLLVFLLGVLVGTLWSIRARIPLVNASNRTVAGLAWAGLAVASMVAVSVAPVPPADRAPSTSSASGDGGRVLKPGPPTAVRRQGTLAPVSSPFPVAASTPPRATPRPTQPATPAPSVAAPSASTPEPSVPESGVTESSAPESSAAGTEGVTPPAASPPTVAGPQTRPAGSPAALLPEGFDPSRYLGQGNKYECSDIPTQAEAQAVLRADPTDPNVVDRDRDGIACETNPPPRDTRRVPRPAP